MTTNDFKELTRAVVLALREELGLDNKELLEKFSSVEGKLKFDGLGITPDIATGGNNQLQIKSEGLYVPPPGPIGEIIAFMGTTAPEHYLACDGATYDIGTYPRLELFFTTQFGTVNHFGGDGTITFAVPDLRGEFLRGAGPNSRDRQGDGGPVGEHQNATEIPALTRGLSANIIWIGGAPSGNSGAMNSDATVTDGAHGYNSVNMINVSNSSTYPLSWSTRPTNTSVLYCIKYE